MKFRQCKTLRGFQVLEFDDANGNPCSMQQSSAVDTEDGLDKPGSSFLWLGWDGEKPVRMHLSREHVLKLCTAMLLWLFTGKLFETNGDKPE